MLFVLWLAKVCLDYFLFLSLTTTTRTTKLLFLFFPPTPYQSPDTFLLKLLNVRIFKNFSSKHSKTLTKYINRMWRCLIKCLAEVSTKVRMLTSSETELSNRLTNLLRSSIRFQQEWHKNTHKKHPKWKKGLKSNAYLNTLYLVSFNLMWWNYGAFGERERLCHSLFSALRVEIPNFLMILLPLISASASLFSQNKNKKNPL